MNAIWLALTLVGTQPDSFTLKQTVWLRAEPSRQGTPLERLPSGATLPILHLDDLPYIATRFGGKTGFIHKGATILTPELAAKIAKAEGREMENPDAPLSSSQAWRSTFRRPGPVSKDITRFEAITPYWGTLAAHLNINKDLDLWATRLGLHSGGWSPFGSDDRVGLELSTNDLNRPWHKTTTGILLLRYISKYLDQNVRAQLNRQIRDILAFDLEIDEFGDEPLRRSYVPLALALTFRAAPDELLDGSCEPTTAAELPGLEWLNELVQTEDFLPPGYGGKWTGVQGGESLRIPVCELFVAYAAILRIRHKELQEAIAAVFGTEGSWNRDDGFQRFDVASENRFFYLAFATLAPAGKPVDLHGPLDVDTWLTSEAQDLRGNDFGITTVLHLLETLSPAGYSEHYGAHGRRWGQELLDSKSLTTFIGTQTPTPAISKLRQALVLAVEATVIEKYMLYNYSHERSIRALSYEVRLAEEELKLNHALQEEDPRFGQAVLGRLQEANLRMELGAPVNTCKNRCYFAFPSLHGPELAYPSQEDLTTFHFGDEFASDEDCLFVTGDVCPGEDFPVPFITGTGNTSQLKHDILIDTCAKLCQGLRRAISVRTALEGIADRSESRDHSVRPPPSNKAWVAEESSVINAARESSPSAANASRISLYPAPMFEGLMAITKGETVTHRHLYEVIDLKEKQAALVTLLALDDPMLLELIDEQNEPTRSGVTDNETKAVTLNFSHDERVRIRITGTESRTRYMLLVWMPAIRE